MDKTQTLARPHAKHASAAAPFTAEQMLGLQNEADQVIPKAVQAELTTPRLYLEGVANRSAMEKSFHELEGTNQGVSLQLPPGVSLALPRTTASG